MKRLPLVTTFSPGSRPSSTGSMRPSATPSLTWRIGLAHIGDQPDSREISDHEDRIARTAGDILARSDLALNDRAADRRGNRRFGTDLSCLFEAFDFGVTAAKNAQAVADGLQGR